MFCFKNVLFLVFLITSSLPTTSHTQLLVAKKTISQVDGFSACALHMATLGMLLGYNKAFKRLGYTPLEALKKSSLITALVAGAGWTYLLSKAYNVQKYIPDEPLDKDMIGIVAYTKAIEFVKSVQDFVKSGEIFGRSMPRLMLKGNAVAEKRAIARGIAHSLQMPYVENDQLQAQQLAGKAAHKRAVLLVKTQDTSDEDQLIICEAGKKIVKNGSCSSTITCRTITADQCAVPLAGIKMLNGSKDDIDQVSAVVADLKKKMQAPLHQRNMIAMDFRGNNDRLKEPAAQAIAHELQLPVVTAYHRYTDEKSEKAYWNGIIERIVQIAEQTEHKSSMLLIQEQGISDQAYRHVLDELAAYQKKYTIQIVVASLAKYVSMNKAYYEQSGTMRYEFIFNKPLTAEQLAIPAWSLSTLYFMSEGERTQLKDMIVDTGKNLAGSSIAIVTDYNTVDRQCEIALAVASLLQMPCVVEGEIPKAFMGDKLIHKGMPTLNREQALELAKNIASQSPQKSCLLCIRVKNGSSRDERVALHKMLQALARTVHNGKGRVLVLFITNDREYRKIAEYSICLNYNTLWHIFNVEDDPQERRNELAHLEVGDMDALRYHLDDSREMFQTIAPHIKLDKIDTSGKTVLHHLVELERYDQAAVLLRLGANPEIKDRSGKTVYHYIKSVSKENWLRSLQENYKNRSLPLMTVELRDTGLPERLVETVLDYAL